MLLYNLWSIYSVNVANRKPYRQLKYLPADNIAVTSVQVYLSATICSKTYRLLLLYITVIELQPWPAYTIRKEIHEKL